HHRKIEKRNLEPRIERRALAVHGIEMPVDVIAVATVGSEGKIFVAQQPETMAANLIGLAKNFRRFVRQMFAQKLRALRTFTARNFAARKKELPRPARRICV